LSSLPLLSLLPFFLSEGWPSRRSKKSHTANLPKKKLCLFVSVLIFILSFSFGTVEANISNTTRRRYAESTIFKRKRKLEVRVQEDDGSEKKKCIFKLFVFQSVVVPWVSTVSFSRLADEGRLLVEIEDSS